MPGPEPSERGVAERGTARRLRGPAPPTKQKPRDPRGSARLRVADPRKAAERLTLVAANAFLAMRLEQLSPAFLPEHEGEATLRLRLSLRPVYRLEGHAALPLEERERLWMAAYLDDLGVLLPLVQRQALAWLRETLPRNRSLLRRLRDEFLAGPTPEYLYLIARHLIPVRVPDPESPTGFFYPFPPWETEKGYREALRAIDPGHLGTVLAHPRRREILATLRDGPAGARQGVERMFAEAEASIDRFEAELKESPEDVWRYRPLVAAGLARTLEELGSPFTPEASRILTRFMVEIGRLKSRDPLATALLVVGIVVGVVAIALSGGAAGALIGGLDLILGAATSVRSAYQGYLRERQNAYAEDAVALHRGEPLTDRPTDYSGVYLDAAGALLCGYFLARGSFGLLQGTGSARASGGTRAGDTADVLGNPALRERLGGAGEARPRVPGPAEEAEEALRLESSAEGAAELSRREHPEWPRHDPATTGTEDAVPLESLAEGVHRGTREAHPEWPREWRRKPRREQLEPRRTRRARKDDPAARERRERESRKRLEREGIEPTRHPPTPRRRQRPVTSAEQLVGIPLDPAFRRRMRGRTPTPEIREWARRQLKAGDPDPAFPWRTILDDAEVEADHIVAIEKIRRFDGFAGLIEENQLLVFNLPENFIAMSKAANASKGQKFFREWELHETLGKVDEAFRQQMIVEEDRLVPLIQERIYELLRQQEEAFEAFRAGGG